ncbi:NAD(P)(+) transhydrogenase (Re/Si-specific) subunit alpha, partial [bacterium]|nr:NAD(P)(+) transhydrogenase (Re/Si-specific) subunit alpha [bacterium]
MRIRVISETAPGERRVALVPRGVSTLKDDGHEVTVVSGAGLGAGVDDSDYEAAGATIVGDNPGPVDLVVGIGPFTVDQVGETAAVLAFLDPLGNPAEMAR